MAERFNIAKEVDVALRDSPERALLILPALAGEILAAGDPVSVADLADVLGMYVLRREPNHHVASAVLAMLRTYAVGNAAHFNN